MAPGKNTFLLQPLLLSFDLKKVMLFSREIYYNCNNFELYSSWSARPWIIFGSTLRTTATQIADTRFQKSQAWPLLAKCRTALHADGFGFILECVSWKKHRMPWYLLLSLIFDTNGWFPIQEFVNVLTNGAKFCQKLKIQIGYYLVFCHLYLFTTNAKLSLLYSRPSGVQSKIREGRPWWKLV